MKPWFPGRLCSWRGDIVVWLKALLSLYLFLLFFGPCHTACGIFSDQWLNWCPCIGNSGSEPLDCPEVPLCLLLFFSLTVSLFIFSLLLAALGLISACGLSQLREWELLSTKAASLTAERRLQVLNSCASRAQLPSGGASSLARDRTCLCCLSGRLLSTGPLEMSFLLSCPVSHASNSLSDGISFRVSFSYCLFSHEAISLITDNAFVHLSVSGK